MTICQQTEERKLFNFEERSQILKSTNGICACCGKKLTTKTMTVEHIIPISRGGTNDIKNLTALCEPCNKLKNNLVYIPMGFYNALIGTPRLQEMNKYVIDWFQSIKDDFEIEMFPMIAPRTNLMITLKQPYKKVKFVRNLMLTWALVGKDYYDEIEAVTEINLKEIRAKVRDYRGETLEKTHSAVAFYSLRKTDTDKILAVVAVSYNKESHDIILYVPWCQISKQQQGYAIYGFVRCLLNAINNIAKYDVYEYTIVSPYEHVFDRFYETCHPRFMGRSFRQKLMYDTRYRNDVTPAIIIDRSNYADAIDAATQKMSEDCKKEKRGIT